MKDRTEDRLADFTRDSRVLILSLMAAVVGVMSAFVAVALVWLINLITNLAFYQQLSGEFQSPSGNHLQWLVVIVPALGGILIGLMARFGSEKIRGHGIPEALEAILYGNSRMDLKVAILKPISSAISIGTGGPFGAEGPIIMTGGAFGSLFAQLFHLSSAERKTLLVAGAAAGMSAIFATPIAAVLLAVELLLFEWKPRSFIPVAIASLVAGSLRVPLLGGGPIFTTASFGAPDMEVMLAALVVGLVAGAGSTILTTLVYLFEDLFGKLPIHWMWWPVLGGIGVGLGGLYDPRVLGVGYDIIRSLLRGEVIGGLLLSLLVGKALVWSFSLGSGTSGGVLAPLLIIGGALGALTSRWIPVGNSGLWALVGMAAMMGGTMRSPLTAIMFALELTHQVNILPALLVACVVAYAFTVLVLRRSILTEKVARRGFHVSREYSVDPLEVLRVEDVMDIEVQSVDSEMKVSELSDKIAAGDAGVTRHNGLMIVDAGGKLVGIITRGDVLRALERDEDVNVLEAGTGDLIVAHPDEILRDAAHRMLSGDVGRLPVVSRMDPNRVVGYLGRPAVLSARKQRMAEEHDRAGWLGARFSPDTL
ncbi:MAG TPA: chloride channel protein [Bacteroidota bacterium]|nr:chloride channel protein [Bacteroidota bacterium]